MIIVSIKSNGSQQSEFQKRVTPDIHLLQKFWHFHFRLHHYKKPLRPSNRIDSISPSFKSSQFLRSFPVFSATMSKGPGLFVDIGKKAKGNQILYLHLSIYIYLYSFQLPVFISPFFECLDLLTKDYTSDQKFTVSTYTDAGVVCQNHLFCILNFD